jgi:hypothetical protein
MISFLDRFKRIEYWTRCEMVLNKYVRDCPDLPTKREYECFLFINIRLSFQGIPVFINNSISIYIV